MTRREAIAVLGAPALLKADAESDVWEVLASMAASLSEDDVPGFLQPVDRNMPGYGDLSTNLNAMILEVNVRSMISPISNEGNESERTLQVDWELHMYPRGNQSPLSTQNNSQGDIARMQTREQPVTLRFRKPGKKWRVTKIDPIAFFAPPDMH